MCQCALWNSSENFLNSKFYKTWLWQWKISQGFRRKLGGLEEPKGSLIEPKLGGVNFFFTNCWFVWEMASSMLEFHCNRW